MAEVERAHVFGDHEYKGTVYPNVVLASSIDGMQTFLVRPDDVWIVTYPKSGTHWMQEIVYLIKARGIPEKIDRSLGSSTIEMIDLKGLKLPATREEELKNSNSTRTQMDVIDQAPSPRVITSHLSLELLPPTLVKTAKVLYVARNPKDALNSFYNFIAKTPLGMSWQMLFSGFMEGRAPFGRWPEHVKPFWEIKEEENVLFCFYESMKKDPLKNVRQIAKFLNEPLTNEVLEKVVEHSSFSGMKQTYDKAAEKGDNIGAGGGLFNFMNKGVSGGWKNRFTVAENEMFDEWYRNQMADSDINFEFK